MSDGVIHTAFIHDFSKFAANCETDRRAIEALGSALAGSDRLRLDAAYLYRLALEKGSAGARYHEVADEGVPFRDIAGVIGRPLNLPVVAKSPEEAADHFGWFAHFAAIDSPASSQRTRERLGWQPKQPGLIPDLDRTRYFDTEKRLAA